MAQRTSVGSRSLTGRRHFGMGWLPWVALLAIALLAVLAWLLIRNIDDEDDNDASRYVPHSTPVLHDASVAA